MSTVMFVTAGGFGLTDAGFPRLPMLFMDQSTVTRPWGALRTVTHEVKPSGDFAPIPLPAPGPDGQSYSYCQGPIQARGRICVNVFGHYVEYGAHGEAVHHIYAEHALAASQVHGRASLRVVRHSTTDFVKWTAPLTVLEFPDPHEPRDWTPDTLANFSFRPKSVVRSPITGVLVMLAAKITPEWLQRHPEYFTVGAIESGGPRCAFVSDDGVRWRGTRSCAWTAPIPHNLSSAPANFWDHDDLNLVWYGGRYVDMQIAIAPCEPAWGECKPVPDNVGTHSPRVLSVRWSEDGDQWSERGGLRKPMPPMYGTDTEFYRWRPFYVGGSGRIAAHVTIYAPQPRMLLPTRIDAMKGQCAAPSGAGREMCHGNHVHDELWVLQEGSPPWDLLAWVRAAPVGASSVRVAPPDAFMHASPAVHDGNLLWVANGAVYAAPQYRLAGQYAATNAVFSTPPLTAPKRALWIDADAQWGRDGGYTGPGCDMACAAYVAVEVRNVSTGDALRGYEAARCVMQNVDGPRLPLRWSDSATGRVRSTAALAGQSIQLVVHLRDAFVYAIGEDEAEEQEAIDAGDGVAAIASASRAAVVNVGSDKVLIAFDDSVIDANASWGYTRTMNPPAKAGAPLVRPDAPWERSHGLGYGLYSSVVRDGGVTRLYLDVENHSAAGRKHGSRPYLVALAEAADGIAFTKPPLRQVPLGGSRENSLIAGLSYPAREGCAVWIDERGELGGRYVSQAKLDNHSVDAIAFATSSDGISWHNVPAATIDAGIGGCDTQNVILPTGARGYRLYTRHWVRPNGRDHPRNVTDGHRRVRRLSALSLLAGSSGGWSDERIVLAPDVADNATHRPDRYIEPPLDYYGATVWKYAPPGAGDSAAGGGGTAVAPYYLMLTERMHHWLGPEDGWSRASGEKPPPGGPATIDVGLAVSRDGASFTHVGARRPFIGLGLTGGWESKMVWALPQPVVMDGEILFYYYGTNVDHNGIVDTESRTGASQSAVSVARLRLDGFLSLDAQLVAVGSEAVVHTKPLTFTGGQLELNVDTQGSGALTVEVLAGDPALSSDAEVLGASYPVATNALAHRVQWARNFSLSSLHQGQPVRLRFRMNGCKLYAFRFFA